jgi:hypothetical protein
MKYEVHVRISVSHDPGVKELLSVTLEQWGLNIFDVSHCSRDELYFMGYFTETTDPPHSLRVNHETLEKQLPEHRVVTYWKEIHSDWDAIYRSKNAP